MATINITGFESGDTTEAGLNGGTFAIVTSPVRTGQYALQCNPASGAQGYVSILGLSSSGGGANMLRTAETFYTFYFRLAAVPSGTTRIAAVETNSGSPVARVNVTAAGAVNLQGSTTSATVATVVADTWYRADMRVTSNGTSFLSIDGSAEQSCTANNLNQDRLNLGRFSTDAVAFDCYYDDVLISDSGFPGAGQIVRLDPNGDGTYTGWAGGSGTTFAEVDDDGPGHDSDTTYIQTPDTGDNTARTFSLESAASAGVVGTILVVKAYTVNRSESTTSTSAVGVRVRNGSTDVDSGTAEWLTNYVSRCMILATDPNGGGAWTSGGLDTLEVGVFAGTIAQAQRSTRVAAMVWSDGVAATTETRTATQSAALQSTLTRTATQSAALSLAGIIRTATQSAALSTTTTKTASQSAALSGTVTRTATQDASLSLAGIVRTATQSAALQSTLTRTATQSAALQSTLTRTATQTAALSLAGIIRTATQSASLAETFTRTASQSAALTSTITRTASQSAALSLAGIVRTATQTASLEVTGVLTLTATQSAALQSTLTRTATQSAALQSTLTRTATQSAALQSTLTRTATQSAALQSTLTRTATQSAALSLSGIIRTATQSAALQSTLTRTAAQSAALSLAGITRTATQSAALSTATTRTASQSAAFSATVTRTAVQSAALSLAGIVRTATQSAALSFTTTRTATQSASLATSTTVELTALQSASLVLETFILIEVSGSDDHIIEVSGSDDHIIPVGGNADMAQLENIVIPLGSDVRIRVTLAATVGDSGSIAGQTYRARIAFKDRLHDIVVSGVPVIFDATGRVVDWVLTDTSLLPANITPGTHYVWDLWRDDTGADIPLVHGQCRFVQYPGSAP